MDTTSSSGRNLRFLPGALLLAGLALTLFYWRYEASQNSTFSLTHFNQLADNMREGGKKRLASLENFSRSVASLFITNDNVSSILWRRFIQALDPKGRYPGLEEFAFTSLVLERDKESFQRQMRLRLLDPAFRIMAQEVRDDYLVVTYHHAIDGIQSTHGPGVDMGSEKQRRKAFGRARDSGRPVFSRAKFRSPNAGTGLMHLLPVYRPGAPLFGVMERRQSLLGWVVTVYDARTLFRDIFRSIRADIRVEVFDGLVIRPGTRIYDSHPGLAPSWSDSTMVKTERAAVSGGLWTFRFTPTEAFIAIVSRRGLALIPLAGMVISVALALAAWVLISGRQRALDQAVLMTRAARENEERLRRTVLYAPIPIMIHDADGTVILVNIRWSELSGHPRGAILSLADWVAKVYPAQGPQKAMERLGPPFAPDMPFKEGELAIHTATGEQRVWIVRSRPLGSPSDGQGMVISMAMDITERKKTEASLVQATKDAEAANQAKSEFLATTSHEIRTPMNVIVGMAEVLSETSLSADQQRYVEVFRRAGDNLLDLINDILDLSKVEAGRMELDQVVFSLTDTLARVMDIMTVRAQEKQLTLRLNTTAPIPDRLVGDPKRLRQVLINLLGNAIKFTHQGGVTIHVRTNREPGTKQVFLISVKDTGIGIPENKQKAVFESFTQADNSTTRQYGGTGLGLAISQRLVALMGGEIGVKSQVGEGSEFWFTAAFTTPAEVPEQPVVADPRQQVKLAGLRILVVDDQADSRLVLAQMVTSLGAHPQLIDSCGGGADLVRHAALDNKPIHAALISCQLGNQSAIHNMTQLRNESGQPDLPTVMVSSYHQKGDLARGRELGVGMLLKPVKGSELREAIQTAISQQKSLKQNPALIARDLNILLVEDSEDNILLIRVFLKKSPYKIDVAHNGAEAVAMVQTKNYDLVLMDVQMPVMDGYTATRKIRDWEQETGRDAIPVIALTAHAFAENERQTMEAGCSCHMTKPITKPRLLAAIAHYSAQKPV